MTDPITIECPACGAMPGDLCDRPRPNRWTGGIPLHPSRINRAKALEMFDAERKAATDAIAERMDIAP